MAVDEEEKESQQIVIPVYKEFSISVSSRQWVVLRGQTPVAYFTTLDEAIKKVIWYAVQTGVAVDDSDVTDLWALVRRVETLSQEIISCFPKEFRSDKVYVAPKPIVKRVVDPLEGLL